MVVNTKGVDLQNLSLEKSLSEYPKSSFKKFLKKIEKEAKSTNQISQSYNIENKILERQKCDLDKIKPAHIENKQSKGNSATDARVKAVMNSLLGGYLYNEPVPIRVMKPSDTNGQLGVLAAGDHRYGAFERLTVSQMICDGLLLDYENNKEDYVIYDMISTNSNDHPPAFAMTTKELSAKLYKIIVDRPDYIDMFDSTKTTYSKNKCFNFIQSYKHNISDSSRKTCLKQIQEKLSEGTIEGMFKTLSSDSEEKKIRGEIGINQDNIRTVEIGMIDRYLFDSIVEVANSDNKIYLMLKVNNSDFAISEENLNEKRANALYNTELKSSAQLAYDNFRKVGMKKKNLENVIILGCYPQHSNEDIRMVVRVTKDPVFGIQSESVSLEDAIKMGSLVSWQIQVLWDNSIMNEKTNIKCIDYKYKEDEYISFEFPVINDQNE